MKGQGYYAKRLSAERLRRCYEIAPVRVKQYLEAEIEYVLSFLGGREQVLELGCGYGRVLSRLCLKAGRAFGIDTSWDSLLLAKTELAGYANSFLICMDAVSMGCRDGVFDLVVCVQNGISAFNVDQHRLLAESVRVTRAGGRVLFSGYAERFWEHRLDWFHRQAAEGLVGAIDTEATGNGVIVCRDGFRAGTLRPQDFLRLTRSLGVKASVREVDGSSLFCEVEVV
jgi:SAM-dependent methyltransferase